MHLLSGRSSTRLAWLLVAPWSVAALLCGACKNTGLSSDPGAAGSKHAQDSGARAYWVRNSPLLDSSAKPVGTIQGPQLVQVGPQGRVMSLPGAAPSIDGYLPAPLLATPKDGEGLVLYAQRLADLHEQSATGPVIGRVYPGAFVSVAPSSPGYFQIALPAFHVHFAGGEKQVVAVVEASAFGTAPQPLQGPLPEGRLVRDFIINAPLWSTELMTEQSPPFVVTLCGDIRVLSVGAHHSKISQYHAGVEILGYYDFQIDVDHYCPIHRCKQRFVVQRGPALWLRGTGTTHRDQVQIPSPPEGFVHAELSNSDALAERIKRRLPVYWLTQSKNHAARCLKWTFDGVTQQRDGSRLTRLEARMRGEPLLIDGKPSLPSFALTYELAHHQQGGTLELVGPNFNQPGTPPGAVGDPNSYRAMIVYSFVGTTPDALRLLDGAWPSNQELVAWHPDDEERWFTSAEACSAATSAASSALSAGAETPPGGFHFDCFHELHE